MQLFGVHNTPVCIVHECVVIAIVHGASVVIAIVHSVSVVIATVHSASVVSAIVHSALSIRGQ